MEAVEASWSRWTVVMLSLTALGCIGVTLAVVLAVMLGTNRRDHHTYSGAPATGFVYDENAPGIPRGEWVDRPGEAPAAQVTGDGTCPCGESESLDAVQSDRASGPEPTASPAAHAEASPTPAPRGGARRAQHHR
jgi:hypothetical protein